MHNLLNFPLTVSTDYPGYAENGEIIISGKVKESSLSEYHTPVTLMIVSPDGNIVKIDQLALNSNNEFSTTLVAGGPLWKAGGDYTVKANYGAQKLKPLSIMQVVVVNYCTTSTT